MTEGRTGLQNRSIHKYCADVAEALNESGQDMRKVLKPEVDIPWTKENVKGIIWHAIQFAMFGTESTKDLTTKQVGEVYEVVNRHLSSKLGVHVPFPEKSVNIEERG